MTPRDDGRLKIFHRPQSGLRYAIGADVSEGLEVGDFSSAFVIDNNYRQVASYHLKVDPDLFGRKLCNLATYYNKAVLAIEVNNHGHAAMAAVKNAKYGNVFIRPIKEERSDEYTSKIGWQTNSKTKMLMLDEFVSLFRDGTLQIRDADLAKEMMELIVAPDGDVVLSGKDRVVAACIACQAIKQASGLYQAIFPHKAPSDIKNVRDRMKAWDAKKNNERYYDE